MSAQSKGTASSSSSPSEGPPAASKAKVKEQIKIIVEDLELVLGDLKDVAKELKEVGSCGTRDLEKLGLIGRVNCDASATGTRSEQVQAKIGGVT